MNDPSSAGSGIGSVADMVSRLRAVMPVSWFPITAPDAAVSATPILDALLSGVGQAWSFCYALTVFVRQQTRITTATGGFLEMICADLFGSVLKRGVGEVDAAFRSRIQANLLLPRATRSALAQTLSTLLSRAPSIFEPWRAADTGGYGGSLSAAAGGGGGYGTPALALGSLSMPFQYLIAMPGTAGSILRESEATFINADDLMQIAPRHVLRPIFTNRTLTGSLIETRGFNLIKDSIGWSGWSLPPPGGPATWMIDTTEAEALLDTQSVLRLSISMGGRFVGPGITLPLVVGPITASAWIKISIVSGLQSLELALVDLAGTSLASVDLTITDGWQRVFIGSAVPDAFTRPITVQLVGQSSTAGTILILTQCWQVEPGSVATSYIPSSHQVGIREADDQTTLQPGSVLQIDQYNLNQAIRRVIPAGSTAWMTPIA